MQKLTHLRTVPKATSREGLGSPLLSRIQPSADAHQQAGRAQAPQEKVPWSWGSPAWDTLSNAWPQRATASPAHPSPAREPGQRTTFLLKLSEAHPTEAVEDFNGAPPFPASLSHHTLPNPQAASGAETGLSRPSSSTRQLGRVAGRPSVPTGSLACPPTSFGCNPAPPGGSQSQQGTATLA